MALQDGTLLTSKKTIEPEAVAVLRRAASLGVQVILATGRMTPAVTPYVGQLGIADLALVTYNGAVALDRDGRVVFHRPVPREVTRKVLQFCIDTDRCANVYLDDQLFSSDRPQHREHLTAYAALAGILATGVPSYEPYLDTEPSKIIVFCQRDHASVSALYDTLAELLKGHETHLVRMDFFVEVLVGGVHKGNGLMGLLDHLRIEHDTAVALGDGENDVEFLQMFGHGIAVANAQPLAKQAAPYTSSLTNDQGVIAVELGRLLDTFYP